MKLIISRHGECEWNIQDRAMSQWDCPLTPKGIRQAYALGDRLRRLWVSCHEAISAVYRLGDYLHRK
ncbi:MULTISPECIES: histidine phosphatase family protein [Planktothricoides]|uniref:Histidine phosphatase family protein n=1 Tax=Planktothricoides raciborskii FACHB-1370 TaxID=2949576 RepID=A0ABR8E8K3_9CYAN|nr:MULTISPECIES: histidine phosphatase family protein [Planktothricoides]MBD2542860.1 histidine phosphatase family protein [Planktothricoides raciborskii FACHB-1370]MBD2581393.1 histidine phosphatase family protein [Planktothricoides raciborskii FACHB-1261]